MIEPIKERIAVEKHNLEQSFLFRIRNKRRLAQKLGLSPSFFNSYDKVIKYSVSAIPKKDGKMRTVEAPNEELKAIQKNILKHLDRIFKEPWLISGRKGKSYIDNARVHAGNTYVKTLDIKSFYENCRRSSVYRMFANKFLMAPDLAGVLTDLVVYENHVPTGAPTSQAITYFVFHDAFRAINELALKYECKFTIYVDDITFSGPSPIPKALNAEVEQILRNAGLAIKWKKAKKYSPKQCKLITGVAVDQQGKIKVPNRLRLKILSSIDEMKKAKKWTKLKCDKKKESVLGMIAAARQIEPGIFPEIEKVIRKIEWRVSDDLRQAKSTLTPNFTS